jgi:hypothetical protein
LPVVDVDTMVPDFGVIEKIEGGHLDMPVFRSAMEVEVPFIVVEPQHGIARAIEFREFDFV